MKFKILIALSASAAAIGCASSGLSGGDGGVRGLSQSAIQTASQQHPQIVAQFGGTVDGARSQYVSAVGRRVAAQSGIQGGGSGAYNFTTLNSPVMNAFAVPGGYVYITRQLLGLMDDEAELASVLGHEVGHIAADHSKQRQDRGILSQLGSLAVGVLTGSSELGQLAGQVGQGLFLSYSRNQEYEADTLGLRYIAQAGYDANASASMLASLGAWTTLESRIRGRDDERAIPSWARTHPLSEERVVRISRAATQLQAPGVGVRNRDEHLRAIDGMIFDDDPAQGVIEESSFLHPDLRLRFTVPQGYAIQNGATSVSIVGTNGQAQFSGGRFQGGLGGYIGQVYQGLLGQQAQVSIPQPRSTTVNGIPAAYTTATINSQQGPVDVSVFAYQWDSNSAYHFATVTRAGSGFGPFTPMIQSLDRLSASEAAAIRPRVIEVVTVRAGDTIQRLASRMAYRTLQTERFLALNSLAPNAPLQPGTKVKLVVYGNRG